MSDVKSRAEMVLKDPACKQLLLIRGAVEPACFFSIVPYLDEFYLVADATTCADPSEPMKANIHGSCSVRLDAGDGVLKIVAHLHSLAGELHRLFANQPSKAMFVNLYDNDFEASIVK